MISPVSRALVFVDTAIRSTGRFNNFSRSPVIWACRRPFNKQIQLVLCKSTAVYRYGLRGMHLPKIVSTFSSCLVALSTYWPCLIRIKFLVAVGLLRSDPSPEWCSCTGACFLLQKARALRIMKTTRAHPRTLQVARYLPIPIIIPACWWLRALMFIFRLVILTSFHSRNKTRPVKLVPQTNSRCTAEQSGYHIAHLTGWHLSHDLRKFHEALHVSQTQAFPVTIAILS